MNLLGGLTSIVTDVVEGKPIGYGLIAQEVLGTGSLEGILSQLQQSGLGEHVQSWIGNGENMPISADQIKAALPIEQLEGLASKCGLNVDQLSHMLAEHLPAVASNAAATGQAQS